MTIRTTPGRELIVVAKPEASLRASASGVKSLAGEEVTALSRTLEAAGAVMRPLFGATEEKLAVASGKMKSAGVHVPPLWNYYRVHAADERLDALADALAALPQVGAAYVKPPVYPADLNDMVTMAGAAQAFASSTSRARGISRTKTSTRTREAWSVARRRPMSTGSITALQ